MPKASALKIVSSDPKFWFALIDMLNSFPVAENSTVITVLPDEENYAEVTSQTQTENSHRI